jgi:phosphoribosylformylglycinamidine cyclo-ligase
MYAEGEYDLAGFIVGSVTEERIVDGSSIQPDDIVLGLPSTGLHTNGYSLARKVVGLTGDLTHDREVLGQPLPGADVTLGDALVAGHRSYLPDVMPLLERGLERGLVRGMAHITGGGLIDNLPRTLPEQCIAVLDPQSWQGLPIFDHLVREAGLSLAERYRVFNMGVGFVLVVRPEDAMTVMADVPEAVAIGRIIPRQTTDEAPVQGLFS